MENESAQIVANKKPRFWPVLQKPGLHYSLLIFIAITTRLDLLFRNHVLSFDDGVYAMSIKHVSEGAIPFQEVFSSQGPFFLMLISIPAQIFGFQPWSMRLVPLIAGIAGIIFTYKIAIRYMAYPLALFASMLVAFSGTFLRATTPLTSDGILAAVVLGCVLLTFRFVDDPKILNAIWLGLAIGFGCGIKSVFMIPLLAFVLISTWKTSFKLRLISGSISVMTFLGAYAMFGFKDAFEQSILYHLGKSESLEFGKNISKIFTTFGSFDPVLLLICLLGGFVAVWYVFQLVRSTPMNFQELRNRIFDFNQPYVFIGTLAVGTVLLQSVQTPLFRNHLSAAVGPLAISTVWILSRMLSNWDYNFENAKLKILVAATVIALAIGFSISIANTYSDPLIEGTPELKGAIASLKDVKENSLMLTNDPGLAFGSSLGVPIGLEDTSRYRFLSDIDNIRISAESFSDELENNDSICVFATAPLPITDELKLKNIAPSDWNQIYDNGYTIWLNPDESCAK